MSGRRGWARLAATLDGKAASKARQVGPPRSKPDVPARQLSLFEPPSDHDQERPGSGDDPVPDTVQVTTKGVRVERRAAPDPSGTRDFGDAYLGLCL